jgi:hypothetical protein
MGIKNTPHALISIHTSAKCVRSQIIGRSNEVNLKELDDEQREPEEDCVAVKAGRLSVVVDGNPFPIRTTWTKITMVLRDSDGGVCLLDLGHERADFNEEEFAIYDSVKRISFGLKTEVSDGGQSMHVHNLDPNFNMFRLDVRLVESDYGFDEGLDYETDSGLRSLALRAVADCLPVSKPLRSLADVRRNEMGGSATATALQPAQVTEKRLLKKVGNEMSHTH